jgi:6-phosphogluconate dehydrogenase
LGDPRVIYLSLPAGRTVDNILEELLPYLQQGDVVMDGGNSFYLDSIEREKRLWNEKAIYFLDCGTSGGLDGARYGACFMVGGKDEGIKRAEPFLTSLAVNRDGCITFWSFGKWTFCKAGPQWNRIWDAAGNRRGR